MSFEKSFCSSPWFHMRINNSGTYESCRWMSKRGDTRVNFDNNIQTVSPLTYFQKNMSELRTTLLEGNSPDMCNDCYTMERHNKISGRQRQLLKVGIQEQYFEKSLISSALKSAFDYSNNNQGHTDRTVLDWQIDLGNYCNSACVFCNPESSSRLAIEFQKIGLIDQLPPTAWCDDPELVDQFVQDLIASTNLQYLHFIGGETIITPGFKTILTALVNAGLAKNITIGFTTNLTVWSDDIIELLKQFQQVNLGMSVETLTKINNYVRYPSTLGKTYQLLERWCRLGREQDWLLQLRITPTCLTVHELNTVYEYAWQNNLAVESCNFIDKPEFFRISVLPQEYRFGVIESLEQWLNEHQIIETQQIINTRNPNVAQEQIVQDARSYLNYLKSAEDESHRLPDLVQYLKKLESSRGNSILTYLPQYEDLFRSNGY
jgi:Radical SAM superfamily